MDANEDLKGLAGGKRQGFVRGVVAVMLVVPAVIGLAACENTPQKVLDRGDVCLEILDLALFDPNTKDADAAEKDVEDRADKLDELADKTEDDKLAGAARDAAKELRDTAPKDRSPASVSEYVSAQNKRLEALRGTCTSMKDYL
ncbi:hypothetical protein [Streptomyces sp. NPDC059452]|uniref:hypothetical protein n=1 Tax=Streptomyces sp. NPDC059452 TaxID=3346835 RepID=UPI003696C1A7